MDDRAFGKIPVEPHGEYEKTDYISSYDVTVPDEFAKDHAPVTVQNIRNNIIQRYSLSSSVIITRG